MLVDELGDRSYRLIVEQACEGILLAQGGFIRFANPRTQELFGYASRELAALPFTSFLYPEDRALVAERHRKRLSGEADPPARYGFRITHRNGEVIPVELKLSVIRWQERPATLCFLEPVPAESTALQVAADTSWFQAPGRDRVDMTRRRVLRRVLASLLLRREKMPGLPMDVAELFAAGWHGAGIRAESAIQRVYVAIGTLRDLGLEGILLTQRGGYLLDPAVDLQIVTPES